MAVEIKLTAQPGDHVKDTAARAIKLAADLDLPVLMNHNDRTVRVGTNSTLAGVLESWESQGKYVEGKHAVGGAWIAYHHDWSNAAIFADELSALRYAMPNAMKVDFWRFGTDAHQIGEA